MSEPADARTRLFEALTSGSPFASWRVQRVTPTQIAAPSIYIDSVELGVEQFEGARFVGAMFPVVLVVDGAVRKQVEALDDALAYVWDAASTVGEPVDSRPVALDVGGPTLRAHIVRVQMIITARTLCAAPLVTIGGQP